jgi:hypothetical protein
MSTDILRWTNTGRIFQPGALTTYVGVSLPLMAITFSTWYLLSKIASRQEARYERHRATVFV